MLRVFGFDLKHQRFAYLRDPGLARHCIFELKATTSDAHLGGEDIDYHMDACRGSRGRATVYKDSALVTTRPSDACELSVDVPKGTAFGTTNTPPPALHPPPRRLPQHFRHAPQASRCTTSTTSTTLPVNQQFFNVTLPHLNLNNQHLFHQHFIHSLSFYAVEFRT